MKKPICAFLALTAALLAPLHAEFRTWTNSAGVAVEAEFVKAEGDDITLRLRNGTLAIYPKAKLSFPDRDFVDAIKDAPQSEATEKPSTAVDPKRKAKWLNRMEKAEEQAKETGLPILVLFTGTSWCPYCVKLEKEVFSESAFKTFADQNLVLLKLDYGPGGSPSNKRDEKLKTEYAVTGFPTYFLIDAEGKRLSRGGYNNGIDPAKFAEWVNRSAPKK